MAGAPQGCTMWHEGYLSELTYDPAWWRGQGFKHKAQAAQDPSRDFVHHRAGQVMIAKGLAIPTPVILKHRRFPPDLYPSSASHVLSGTAAFDKRRSELVEGELAEVLKPYEFMRPSPPVSADGFR